MMSTDIHSGTKVIEKPDPKAPPAEMTFRSGSIESVAPDGAVTVLWQEPMGAGVKSLRLTRQTFTAAEFAAKCVALGGD